MKILSVDTCFGYANIAVSFSNKDSLKHYTKSIDEKNKQAEELFVKINDLFAEISQQNPNKENFSYQDVDIFCAASGPGSFTGLRIGFAAVQALAFSLNKPFIAVNIFEAIEDKLNTEYLTTSSSTITNDLQQRTPSANELFICIRAGMTQFYIQQIIFYNDAYTLTGKPYMINTEQLSNENKYNNPNNIYLCLDRLPELHELGLKQIIIDYDAANLSSYLLKLLNNPNTDKNLQNRQSPLYIKPADAKISKKYKLKIHSI